MKGKKQKDKKYLTYLETLSSIVYNLNKDNIELSVEKILENFDTHFPITFIRIISQLVYSSFICQSGDANVLLTFLQLIQEKNSSFLQDNYTTKDLLSLLNFLYKPQESYYFVESMIEKKMIEPSFVKSFDTFYFAHYKTDEEIQQILFKEKNSEKLIENIEELKKDDWFLHKKLIHEGVNPLEIAKVIRNDDLEKLQELLSNNSFICFQKIPPSIYEKYSFINEKEVSLVSYAAYFGSVKCFKYLVLDYPHFLRDKTNEIGKYAVAGGNLEILHLCEQNKVSFAKSYEIAIEYHRNDIFRYLFDNKKIKFRKKDLPDIGKKCIIFFNYELISYLEENGMKTNEDLINEAAKIGNIFLINHFLEGRNPPNDILYNSILSRNFELVKYFVEEVKIDINTKNVF